MKDVVAEKQQMENLKENIAKAQQRIKSHADKGKTEREIFVGD